MFFVSLKYLIKRKRFRKPYFVTCCILASRPTYLYILLKVLSGRRNYSKMRVGDVHSTLRRRINEVYCSLLAGPHWKIFNRFHTFVELVGHCVFLTVHVTVPWPACVVRFPSGVCDTVAKTRNRGLFAHSNDT